MPRGCRGQGGHDPCSPHCSAEKLHSLSLHRYVISALPVSTENSGHGPQAVFLFNSGYPNHPKGQALFFPLTSLPSPPRNSSKHIACTVQIPRPFPSHLPPPTPSYIPPSAGYIPARISWSLVFLLSLSSPLTLHS